MNELRSTYVDMVASIGGLAAARNADQVHTMVFILFRATAVDQFDYLAGGKKVDVGSHVYGDNNVGGSTSKRAR